MVYGTVIGKDHILYKINELADFSFVNREMAQFYHDRLGRIAIEPEILARTMVAQYLYNWSDRVCADMVNNHITVKWFVGLGVAQEGFDFSLLSRYRKLLRENDKERMVFDAVIEQLMEAGYIGRKEKVMMDATHLAADVAIPTATRLIRDGIELTLEVMEQETKPLWVEAVGALGLEAYLKEEDRKEYLLDPQEKAVRLNATARDAWRLKEWMKEKMRGGAGLSERMVKTLRLLEKVLEDYVDEDNGDEPPPKRKRGRDRKGSVEGKAKKRGRKKFKERKKKGAGRIVSFVDEDARWGAKSDNKTFAGYKAHTMENENQMILDVAVTAGNVSDDAPVLDTVERVENTFDITIEKLTGDTKYGTGDIREKMAEKGAAVVAPLMPPTNKKGYYTNDKFRYDEAADEVVCPAGRRSFRKARDNDSRCFVHFFAADECNTCPKKKKCTESASGRAVSVSDFRLLFAAAGQYNATDAYKEDLKLRAHIEPKQWEMKQRHGFARVRYRGLGRVAQQGFNIAAVINLKRWATLKNAGVRGGNTPENVTYAKVANS
jgi:transposase